MTADLSALEPSVSALAGLIRGIWKRMNMSRHAGVGFGRPPRFARHDRALGYCIYRSLIMCGVVAIAKFELMEQLALRDDEIVRLTAERLAGDLGRSTEDAERAVRDELARWRSHARIQTFVAIFAERAARERLRTDQRAS